MAEPYSMIHKEIITVLQTNNRPLTALEIANKLAAGDRTQVSPLKKKINRDLSTRQDVFTKSDDQPPKWQLRQPFSCSTFSTTTQHNLACSAPRLDEVHKTEKYSQPGLPTLEPTMPSTNPGSCPAQAWTTHTAQPTNFSQASNSTLPLEEKILSFLATSSVALPAVKIARAVGKATAKDINPTLYGLEKKHKVQQESGPTSKKLWKLASHTPNSGPISNGASPTPHQHGASIAPSPGTGIGSEDLYRKTDIDGGHILFSKVNAVKAEPTVTPISATEQPTVPLSVEESAESPVQPSQPSLSSQQQSHGNQVSRPIQVEFDDRSEDQPPVDSVMFPDPINFKDRKKLLEKDDKDGKQISGAKPIKMAVTENAAAVINAANNEAPETVEDSPSRALSAQTLASSSPSSSMLDSGTTISSLSSLSLEPDSVDHFTDETSASASGVEGAGLREGKKQKKKKKLTLACSFPSESKK